jgi:hypothetical protein
MTTVITPNAEQSAKIAKVGRQPRPMLFLSPRSEENRKPIRRQIPGGTIVRANHQVRPDFLIS